MSRTTEIRDICGDYAFDVEYSADHTFTMFFNSRRNAETVKRCIELDDSVPNVATAVDFVEVVRCRDCKHFVFDKNRAMCGRRATFEYGEWLGLTATDFDHYCSYGERREDDGR